MLSVPRTLFAVLLTVVIGVYVFFHFHAIFFSTAAVVNRQIVAAQETVTLGPYNDYVAGRRRADDADRLPGMPDLSPFTVDKVAAMAPAASPGKVDVAVMATVTALKEFIKKNGRIQGLRLAQMDVNPKGLVIRSGNFDMPHLYDAAQKVAPGAVTRQADGAYMLRMPLLVSKGASLTVSGRDTPQLRLSQDANALIANAGDLFILRTKVTGWSEKEGRPALFRDKDVFRPYLVDWSGGRLYIAGAALSSLGYRKGKAYGVSYSTCLPCAIEDPKLAAPTGIIVGSSFSDLYFGFYSYEAENVAIVGNIYANNVIYGIDLHDRSRRLIIARNEAYGSTKKHGIIISRNVTDSWIFDNDCHDNHGSGIMIDRTSEHNNIANNTARHNGGDGITFYESGNITAFGNKVYDNGLSGVRIRNSWNIRLAGDQIFNNTRAAVTVYSARLEETQTGRNFALDPYTRKASADISGDVVKLGDTKPAFKIDGISHLSLTDTHVLSGGPLFSRHIFEDETAIADDMTAAQHAAVITNLKPPPQAPAK
jgi:poly(beta-D-mannuronate) C5 epimerase